MRFKTMHLWQALPERCPPESLSNILHIQSLMQLTPRGLLRICNGARWRLAGIPGFF